MFLSLIVALGPERARSAAFNMATGASPGGVVALLFCYLPLTGGLALGLALMMRRSLFSLIGPRGPALGNFLRVALPLTGLWLILMPLSVMSGSVTPHLTLWQQLPWLPLALLGLHFANNASAVLMVGLKGNLGGLALYTSTADPGDLGGALWFLVIDTVSLAIGWLSARLILRV